MDQVSYTVNQVINDFQSIISNNVERIAKNKSHFTLPYLPEQSLLLIIETFTELMSSTSTLIEINSAKPIIIIGDLHGHILDLLRILKIHQFPPVTRYLFLGDMIDRGEFSLETIMLIYSLKIQFPDEIYIIRGNHEFSDISEKSGFYNELSGVYGSSTPTVFSEFIKSFSVLPLAAVIDNSYFIVHGGIGPSINNLNDIRSAQKSINLDSQLLIDLLWSDPSEEPGFSKSSRGYGCMYGPDVTTNFLLASNLKQIIRGHQCVDGIQKSSDEKVVTIFSASSYCGSSRNKSGILIIQCGMERFINYQPLPYLQRFTATFVQYENKLAFPFAKNNISQPIKMTSTNKSSDFFLELRDKQTKCNSSYFLNSHPQKKTLNNNFSKIWTHLPNL